MRLVKGGEKLGGGESVAVKMTALQTNSGATIVSFVPSQRLLPEYWDILANTYLQGDSILEYHVSKRRLVALVQLSPEEAMSDFEGIFNRIVEAVEAGGKPVP